MMAALELSRFNIPVRLIDKNEKPEATSRAIGVQLAPVTVFVKLLVGLDVRGNVVVFKVRALRAPAGSREGLSPPSTRIRMHV